MWLSRCQRDASQTLLAPPWPEAQLPQPVRAPGICHTTQATISMWVTDVSSKEHFILGGTVKFSVLWWIEPQ